MKIDSRQLRNVLAIVEHGTFNRAAEALGISQPALSKSIALLESRLGQTLFQRGARGSTLTLAGEIVARGARNVEQIIVRTQLEIVASSRLVRGPLLVGATPSMMLGIVPDVVSRLAGSEANLLLSLVEDLDDRLTAALARGEIDLLMGPVDGLHPPPPLIVEEKMAEEYFRLALPPSHRLAGKKQVKLDDLTAEAWVLPTPGSSFYRAVEAMFRAAGSAWPRDQVGTNNLFTLERLVVTSGRIAIVTPAQLYGRQSPIVSVSISGAPKRSIGIRRLADISLPSVADEFIEHTMAVMQQL